jgi:hypothetical protein
MGRRFLLVQRAVLIAEQAQTQSLIQFVQRQAPGALRVRLIEERAVHGVSPASIPVTPDGQSPPDRASKPVAQAHARTVSHYRPKDNQRISVSPNRRQRRQTNH